MRTFYNDYLAFVNSLEALFLDYLANFIQGQFEYIIIYLRVLTKGIFRNIIMSVEEQDSVLKTKLFFYMVITLRNRKRSVRIRKIRKKTTMKLWTMKSIRLAAPFIILVPLLLVSLLGAAKPVEAG